MITIFMNSESSKTHMDHILFQIFKINLGISLER